MIFKFHSRVPLMERVGENPSEPTRQNITGITRQIDLLQIKAIEEGAQSRPEQSGSVLGRRRRLLFGSFSLCSCTQPPRVPFWLCSIPLGRWIYVPEPVFSSLK
ncbi:unnamed protein product [Rangifer tarandus platyrhynchus]|uniref:Uncharacterized protein n=1 Tax=Rangifer tarandus platyrhynchus TaxID=3082113 RepID=A0AC59ZT08_RANTA